ncbi:MAG TPA: protein kinase [Kineosporiaceae bacterium]|nr:protein kinase [Kineosporiaceae bacterium]
MTAGRDPLVGRDRLVGRDPLLGRVVDGRYAVTARVARGGMATVYLALDRRLDRDVALKVMHAHLGDDQQFTARFIREARSAARLSHPGIVAVFDQGEDDGLLYLAMEYLEGRTLRQVLGELGVLTPGEALDVLEPTLDALAAAHAAGIVHRDVKPENVILTDDGRVKVADFGLARAASGVAATAGVLMGTAAYMAPELIADGLADARGDVYAAGILLFEMLTGRPPFAGDVPLRIAYRHVHEDVPPPSSLVGELPEPLDVLVTVATARDPARRPADAGALLALERSARARVPRPALAVRPARSRPPAGRPHPAGRASHTRMLAPDEPVHPTEALVDPVVEGPGDAVRDDPFPRTSRWTRDDGHDRLGPHIRELTTWARRRRQRGTAALLAVLTGATALAVWTWCAAQGASPFSG